MFLFQEKFQEERTLRQEVLRNRFKHQEQEIGDNKFNKLSICSQHKLLNIIGKNIWIKWKIF